MNVFSPRASVVASRKPAAYRRRESVLWFRRNFRGKMEKTFVSVCLGPVLLLSSRPGLIREQGGLLSTMSSAMLQREIMQSFKLRGLGLGRDSLKVLMDHLQQQHSHKDELARIVDYVVGSSDREYP
jgi:hypothetical protein